MPSNYRKKRIIRQKWYNTNSQSQRCSAKLSYQTNSDAVKCRTANRKAVDKTGKKLNNAATQRLLQDKVDQLEKNRARARVSTKKRLEENAEYRQNNLAQARVNTKRRLAENAEYRQKNLTQARVNTKRRLAENAEYRQKNRERARERMKVVSNKPTYKESRNQYTGKSKVRKVRQKTVPTRQQQYWIRRKIRLATARQQGRLFILQKRMQSVSSVYLLDIRLLFNKAEHTVKRALAKLRGLHSSEREKARTRLQELPVDSDLNEADITAVFGPERTHTACSEPYFAEQAYRVISSPTPNPIPVDSFGRAHVFKSATTATDTHQSQEPVTATDDASELQESASVNNIRVPWLCDESICNINADISTGAIHLLQQIVTTNSTNCFEYYTSLNCCKNPARRPDRLGHPLHCRLDCDCPSLLRPARILSCHFPGLRSTVRRVYEMRHVALVVQAVRTTMESGSYEDLKAAVDSLHNVVSRTAAPDDSQPGEQVQGRPPLTEDEVMQQFGKALRAAIKIRDTYTTTACDVCEQLRSDLQSLRSYERRKGFDSAKMQDIIELLYVNKTQYEDVEKFIDNTVVCKYCADKLRGNKDIARSAFNRLAVIETPDCIKQLNIFERSLIKHCITSIAVIRLGQVSTKHRPPNESNSALKGRIAYLPVDVTSNANFLPDKLLNVDSLVLLVGGQPTTKQKVWTSAVDLRKVHTALDWLREHNPLYTDVPAYTIEQMGRIIRDRLAGTSEDSEPANAALIKKLDDASKSHLYENFTVQPLSADYPPDALVDYQFNKVSGLSSNIFDSDLDLKTYPELFPTAVNGMKDALRTVKIGTSDYIKSRLLNKHSKFRLNMNYLFHCFQVQEVSNMCHSVGHMLRSVTGNNLTAQQFHDRLAAKDGEVQSKMFSLLANIRGTKEFFAKLGMDVRWMIKRLGPPTLFLTCATAEWFSEALLTHLRTINSDVSNINQMTPAELCAMDPVTVTNHFYKKWEAIFTHLINAKDTPLFGPVADFFWRIEYQARGAPHVHCVLWIKDAPVLGTNTPEEVRQYIDKVCTCANPPAATSPTLHKLVSQFQVHKCNKYCVKLYKRNGKFARKCRFGFPRPVKDSTQLNDVIDCLAVNQSKQPRKRLYNLRRAADELNINDYNPALLLANEANVDIQFIGHVGSRLPYYITEYMTKHERSEQDEMWQDIFTSSKSLGTNAMSFMLKSVKSRQVGANEAADRLLGHKLYSKSCQMRFADLQPADKVKRVLRPAADIQKLLKSNPDSEDIFFPHWVLDVYPARPDELENMSLNELVGWHEKTKVVTHKEPLQLKGLDLCLKRRTKKPYLITHQVVNPQQSEEKKQLYFYYLLKLFKPWRTESDLLLPGMTHFETFEAERSRLPDMADYYDHNVKVAEQDQQIELEVKERTDEVRQGEGDVEEDEEAALQGCADDHAVTAMHEVIEAHRNVTRMDSAGNEELLQKYNSLNADQKRVVDRVISKIANDDKIHLIVSGQGGTGKSRVIDVLNRMVSKDSRPNTIPVVVAAPTGLAAFNVGGTTIHRLLCLPVEHGKPADYSRLGQEQLTVVRAALRGLKLLIIDEVSMVSSLTLLYIHLRLSEIMSSSELFGSISVVFFADFLQLPPVKGNQPFIAVTFLEAKQRIGSIASLTLWTAFEYEELTVNMRQSGDLSYAQLLSSARIGHISDDHRQSLCSQFIAPGRRASVDETCDHYKTLVEAGHTPIILMPRSAQCNEMNCAMLKRIGGEIYSVPSLDTLDTIVTKQMMAKVTAAYKKAEQDTTRTAGLESCLQLCIGAKVMLRRNKDVEAGLVNGSLGTVAGLERRTRKGAVEIVQIKQCSR